MSGWNNWNLRKKLFSVILLVLIFDIVILLVMGSTLFEKFYLQRKKTDLEESSEKIAAAYQKQGADFYDEIQALENQNMMVSLLYYDGDGQLQMEEYHSRIRADGNSKAPVRLPQEFAKELEEEWNRKKQWEIEDLERRLAQIPQTGTFIYTGQPEGGPEGNDFLRSLTRLDENLYLYICTPQDYIKSTADMAVKYTAMLSILSLVAGGILLYFVVGKVVKPITKIQQTADRISKMDFSHSCEVKGNDEVAKLATSINHMSGSLQASIGKLVEANQVLKDDLIRQQQTDRMRQQFIANVSHDFKTPLTLMVSYAEALSQQIQDEQGLECCNIIISEGNRLSNMVGRLLELSKLENGIDQVECSLFCLGEIIDTVIRNYHIITEKRSIQVKRELEDEFIVSADYQKIGRVISNLFENAFKYTGDQGTITVGAKKQEDQCYIYLDNTCPPIAQEDIGSIFDSFYRADKSRTKIDGYGLGLAIVKVIMEAHQERYGVENTENGVRFWFCLPLADMAEDDIDEDLEYDAADDIEAEE